MQSRITHKPEFLEWPSTNPIPSASATTCSAKTSVSAARRANVASVKPPSARPARRMPATARKPSKSDQPSTYHVATFHRYPHHRHGIGSDRLPPGPMGCPHERRPGSIPGNHPSRRHRRALAAREVRPAGAGQSHRCAPESHPAPVRAHLRGEVMHKRRTYGPLCIARRHPRLFAMLTRGMR